jgi:electron transfer flavoprotein alpha subunit
VESILLLAHTEPGGWLAKPALEALAAAKGLGGELTVGLAGAETQAAANQIAGCGAARFLAVTGEAFAEARYSTDAAAA